MKVPPWPLGKAPRSLQGWGNASPKSSILGHPIPQWASTVSSPLWNSQNRPVGPGLAAPSFLGSCLQGAVGPSRMGKAQDAAISWPCTGHGFVGPHAALAQGRCKVNNGLYCGTWFVPSHLWKETEALASPGSGGHVRRGPGWCPAGPPELGLPVPPPCPRQAPTAGGW